MSADMVRDTLIGERSMTEEQIRNWKVERDIARSIKDENERRAALEKVYDHRDEMQMECIAHQSDRVKAIKANLEAMKVEISDVKKDLRPCVETDKEYRIQKERIKGAKAMLMILKWIVVAGGGAFVMRLIQSYPG